MEDERKSSIDTLSTTASAANTLRGAIKTGKAVDGIAQGSAVHLVCTRPINTWLRRETTMLLRLLIIPPGTGSMQKIRWSGLLT